MNARKLLAGVGLALMTLAVASTASADTPWQRHQPRREEVDARLANQNRRIRMARREGEINGRQAAALHAQDRAIRAQERFYGAGDHSHITGGDQRQLNREENQVSREIGR